MLDYKIVVGNSLVAKFEDDVIAIDWELKEGTQTGLFGNTNVEKGQDLLKEISKKQHTFFISENHDKKAIALKIRNLKIDLLINQLELMIKEKHQTDEPKATSYRTKTLFMKAQEAYLQTLGWQQNIQKLKRIKENPTATLHFFDWKLDFPEILNPALASNQTGFDIVIGNPPYVNVANIKDDIFRDFLKKEFKVSKNKTDLYAFFIEKGKKLLKNNGTLTFIIPNSWLGTESFFPLRQMFIEETKLNYVVKCPSDVFDAAVTTVIISFNNTTIIENNVKLFLLKNKEFSSIGQTNYEIIKNKVSYGFSFNEEVKIEKYDDKLGDIAKFSLGIKTSDDTRFILDNKINEDCYPLLRGVHFTISLCCIFIMLDNSFPLIG